MVQTLIQLSGWTKHVFDWSKCNLLLIDMQKQYQMGALDLKQAGQLAVTQTK